MKLSAALTLALATLAAANPFRPASSNNAKSAYMSKLMKGAKATRKLEQEIDLTAYSLKFEQCQFVKTYSDDLADDEDSATVLATQRFVIFRLCPDGYCSSCNYNYGEYVIDLESYLEATVQYQQELQEQMCQNCENYCMADQEEEQQDENQDNGEEENQDENEDGGRRLALRQLANVDCDTCYEECQKIENMEENGYVDATNFLECQMIYDPEDDGASALYAGPICASYGTKIKIGVFTDEECMTVDASKDVEDYLMDGDGYQMKLSHALLKTIYAEDTCISCIQEQEEDQNGDNNNNNGEQQAAETNEMCMQLYEQAAKCEDSHGFEGGYNMYGNNNNNNNNGQNQWYNQEAQEELVCNFITSLQSGTYDESGEIIISGGSSVVGGGSTTTGGQKFALTFFILGTVGLAVYAAMLHSKLTKGGKADLGSQGGAMA
jgi:hypothetical protein